MTATLPLAPAAHHASQEAREASLEAQFVSLMTQLDTALEARRKLPRPASAIPANATTPNPPAAPFVAMPDVAEMSRDELEAFFARANPADPRYDPVWAQTQAQHALAQTEAQARLAEGRTAYPRERGRFTAGNPGGPGRPRKPRTVQQDIVTIMANRISDEAWGQMTDTAVLQAIEGDNSARRWLFQMLFKNGALNDAAAVAASGLTEDEHRLHLARERYGQAMAAAEAARAELAELEAATATRAERPASAPNPPIPAAPEPGLAAQEAADLSVDEPEGKEHAEPAANTEVVEVRLAPRATAPDLTRNERLSTADRAAPPFSEPGRNGKKRSETANNGRCAAGA